MAYGVILKHLEVDKITWGSFSKKKKNYNFFKEGLKPLQKKTFRQERGAEHPFLNWCGEHLPFTGKLLSRTF
jgi:hypothetical protein